MSLIYYLRVIKSILFTGAAGANKYVNFGAIIKFDFFDQFYFKIVNFLKLFLSVFVVLIVIFLFKFDYIYINLNYLFVESLYGVDVFLNS